MACANVFDALKARSEDLGPTLYTRASWKDVWENVIPKDTFPNGAGYTRSAFTIGRSEPTSDEETWTTIAAIDANSNPSGACNITYNAVEVGFKQNDYKPAAYGLRGPVICQDELAMNWNVAAFWEKYFQALEKRSARSISNRKANVYMQYVPKVSCNSSFDWKDGDFTTQPASSVVDTTDLDANAGNLPDSELTQEMLDATALVLMEEGADDPNTNGWITQGNDGPEFPLYIGAWASKRIAINNSELRNDLNNGFSGRADVSPVLKRIGASRVIGNFRHVINRFPPRWKLDTDTGTLVRVPVWTMSSVAANATKGSVAVLNPDWLNPAVAKYEGAIVLNPWVMTEEVLQPLNSVPGAKFNPANYYGEWQFVTGNDAFINTGDSCTGITDPLHRKGRHFGEYRTAFKPLFPSYGRLILFTRCDDAFDTVTCS